MNLTCLTLPLRFDRQTPERKLVSFIAYLSEFEKLYYKS